MAVRIGISGLGRIGRMALRAAMTNPEIEVAAINATSDTATLAHLLKYDSVQGKWEAEVVASGSDLFIDGRRIEVLSERDPLRLPWGELGVDVVLEATGKFVERDAAAKHLRAGARKVLISTAAKSDDLTVVYGVNHHLYDPEQHDVISGASCTTNCLAPVVLILQEEFGIVEGSMTTVHSFTGDQKPLDNPHKDLRRARSATQSIVPTTTGAARALGKVIPSLAGKMNGVSIRVPTPDVSLLDLVVSLENRASADEVNDVLREASKSRLSGVLDVSLAPLVSVDYIGNTHSAIVDGLSTMLIGERTVKLLAWYDNEMGYAHRMVDLMHYVGSPIAENEWVVDGTQ